MIDILAPLGLVLMVAFVAAFVLAARRQNATKRRVFEEYAEQEGFRHLARDDGTAERLSRGFEGFAVFSSPSLGRRRPDDVVVGNVDEGRICVFRHGVRTAEGDSREWWVCLLEAPQALDPAGLERRAAPPFEVEAQVRGSRLAVSLAGRNAQLDSADDVASFVAYTRSLARRLASTTG